MVLNVKCVMVWYRSAWSGVVWYGMVLNVKCVMVWYISAWSGVVWYDMVWY